MKMTRKTYKDFATGKIRYTNGLFIGWTKPMGILNMPYAKFKRTHSTLLVPECLLTKECREAISGILEVVNS